LGTAIALPFLEAMAPVYSLAGAAAEPLPRRMAILYVPNGIHMEDWTPATEGANFELTPTLQALAPFKQDLLVLSGLTCDKARPNGDGPGDHARAMSAFLTGCQPRKTHGADIKVGISMDQVCAQKIGHQTRLPSLEIGCDKGLQSGNCDSGYSCAYSANLSWRTESMPMAKEVNPRLVFDRLFTNGVKGESEQVQARRERYKQSILDFVMEDAHHLRRRLGANDRRKMEEYLSAIRELEVRLARTDEDAPQPEDAPLARPAGVPQEYAEHIRLMCDLLVLAFQGDHTRICTFPLANEGSNRSYRFINVPEGHHDLSHHGRNKEKQAKIAAINRFHISQLAYLVGKLKAIPEGDGTLLDNCMIVYGSAIGDGNRHNHDNLPILLLGKGGGSIKTGRHLVYPRNTPVNNLWLAILDRMGAHVDQLGDSTGLLEGLS
jgi:hypothetical protein